MPGRGPEILGPWAVLECRGPQGGQRQEGLQSRQHDALNPAFKHFRLMGCGVFLTPTFLEIPSMEIILYIHYISMYLKAVSAGNEIFSHSTF